MARILVNKKYYEDRLAPVLGKSSEDGTFLQVEGIGVDFLQKMAFDTPFTEDAGFECAEMKGEGKDTGKSSQSFCRLGPAQVTISHLHDT